MIAVCGANVSVEKLSRKDVERPKGAAAFWKGVPHGKLADAILDGARERRWEVLESRFSLSKDKADLAGAFELRVPSVAVPEGQTLALGILTSNAMRRAMKLVVGTNVLVCQNGMATGEVVLRRKHTTNFDIGEAIDEALDSFEQKAAGIAACVQQLRELELNPQTSEHLLLEAGRNGLMPWSRLGDVDKEYRHPTFAEHGTGTGWALLNAFTYVVKRNPPLSQMEQMNGFRELILTTAA